MSTVSTIWTSPIVEMFDRSGPTGAPGWNNKGPWVAGTYRRRDAVTYDNKIWVALKKTTATPSTSVPNDWLMFYDFTALLAVVGVVPGSVSAKGLRRALVSQGKLDDVVMGLPADIADTARIHWDTAFPVAPNDALWTNIKATLAYSDAQMATLLALALVS